MGISVKLDEIGKSKLEKMQAKLRLEANIKIDQYRLLRTLISFGEENFNLLLSFLQGVTLTDEEIKEFHKQHIKEGKYLFPEKTDDELIYGE